MSGAGLGIGSTRLEISVDKQGRVHGYVGSHSDYRAVGEPINLSSNWRSRFGGTMPQPAVGCVEGSCTFSTIHFSVERERPPPPLPPPEPPKPPVKPVVQAHNPPANTKKNPPLKKPESGKKPTVTAKKSSPH